MLGTDHTELGPGSPSSRGFRSQIEMLIGSAGLKQETQMKRQLLDGWSQTQSPGGWSSDTHHPTPSLILTSGLALRPSRPCNLYVETPNPSLSMWDFCHNRGFSHICRDSH